MTQPDLSPAELARYARHLALPEFGLTAQRRLKRSAVLCIGAGGLGSPAALYLAAAGVGRLGIVDPDRVDRSNLHRQILHGEGGVGQAKTESAAARLRDLNPHVDIVTHPDRFTPDNAAGIARGYDAIVDGSDNFPTRYLTNDIGFFARIPNIYASIHRFSGQLTVFAPHLGGPCLRCVMPAPPPEAVPSCAEAGVLGVLPGVLGCLQAVEAIKLLAGVGELALGRLVHFDALAMRFREVALARDPDCRLCGRRPEVHSPDNPETRAAAACAAADGIPEIDVETLQVRLAEPGCLLLDVRTRRERAQAAIAGSQHIPLAGLEAAAGGLDPRREIIVYCAVGVRSLAAARQLRAAGFPRVAHVTGGIREWIANGLPVVRA